MAEIVQEIFVDKIDDPQHAMRSQIRDESLWELADNIKYHGLINPITVRPVGSRYEVVAGHRRFSAIKINGQLRVACVVRELNDKEAFGVMAAENLERKDVDIVDEASFILQYMDQTGSDVKETAKSLRRSVSYVESRLEVGEMPDYLKDHLKNNRIKLGAALALSKIPNERIRKSWIEQGVQNGISVTQAEFQLNDYLTHSAMFDGIIEANPEDTASYEPRPVMFRCAIDGREYDARLMRSVFIYEENLPVLHSIASELQKDPAKI